MERNFLIQLTNNLYRLTLLFPKKEPLRYKMRELADEILANLVSNPSKKTETRSPRILEDLEVLDSFFEVAKAQNWVSPSDILEIQREYGKIREDYYPPTALQPQPTRPKKVISVPSSERQSKILEILKEKKRAQVWEIKKIFPEITKRTLRRDFEFLLKKGIIERIGERNETFYQLKLGQDIR